MYESSTGQVSLAARGAMPRFRNVAVEVIPAGARLAKRRYNGPVAEVQLARLRAFFEGVEHRRPSSGSNGVRVTIWGDGETRSGLLYLTATETQELLRMMGFTKAPGSRGLRGYGADEPPATTEKKTDWTTALYIGGAAVAGFTLAWILKK